MIFLFIFLWMIGAIVTCGVFIHIDPDEYGGEFTWLWMLVCSASWPLMAICGLTYLIFTKIGKLATAVAGFLDSFRKEED